MTLFERRRSGVGTAILCGVGGLLVGAGVVAALTPVPGAELRRRVVDFINTKALRRGGDESLERQLDRMEGEGGVGHEVSPPQSNNRYESHS